MLNIAKDFSFNWKGKLFFSNALIFTNINMNISEKSVIFYYFCFWKLCFTDRKAYFKCQFDFSWNFTIFFLSYLSSRDVDTIENHVNPLYINVDSIVYNHWKYYEKFWKHSGANVSLKKDCWRVNMKSKNGKILNVQHINTLRGGRIPPLGRARIFTGRIAQGILSVFSGFFDAQINSLYILNINEN